GDGLLLGQGPGRRDPSALKALLGKTAKLTFRMVDVTMPAEQAVASRPPAEDDILYSQDGKTPYLIERRVLVPGEDLTDAQAGFDHRTNQPGVNFRFNTSGAR